MMWTSRLPLILKEKLLWWQEFLHNSFYSYVSGGTNYLTIGSRLTCILTSQYFWCLVEVEQGFFNHGSQALVIVCFNVCAKIWADELSVIVIIKICSRKSLYDIPLLHWSNFLQCSLSCQLLIVLVPFCFFVTPGAWPTMAMDQM